MDVAFINRTLGMTRGGGEIWDLRIADALEEMGVNITFYTGKPLTTNLSHPITEFNSTEVPTPYLKDFAYRAPIGVGGVFDDIDTLFFAWRAAKELQRTEHDIIHVNSDPQFGRFTDQFDKPVVLKMNGPPHSLWQDHLHLFSSSYDFFYDFDSVIATGVTTKEIENRTNIDIHTVNPGVDTDHFTPDFEKTDGKTILFVGRFVPAKNLITLVRTFNDVQSTHPGAKLILVGEGPCEGRIKSEIDKLDLNKSVSLPGYVENDDISHYYRKSDIFALSSRQDNHPITLLEAMSCGKPIVAPRIGWIPHIVDHGDNGLLHDDAEELTENLNCLLSNPQLRRQYGKHGTQKAHKGFDWKQRAEEVISIYQDLKT